MTAGKFSGIFEIARRLRAGASISPEEADLIAVALDAYMNSAPAPGQRTPQTLADLAERDQLLREIADACFAGASTLAKAEGVHALLARYAASGWLRDRSSAICPKRLIGTHFERCWRVLTLRDRVPSTRQLRKIVGPKLGVLRANDAA